MRIVLASVVVLAGCVSERPPAPPPARGAITMTAVDAAGRAVAGARVDYQQAGALPCDPATPPALAYFVTGRAVADADGRVRLPGPMYVRAVAPDGEVGFAHVDRVATVVVHRPARVVVEPRCDGACPRFVAWGTLTMGDVRCTPVAEQAGPDAVLRLPPLARGALELRLHAGDGTDDERYTVVHAAIDGAARLTPALPRVAGPYVVHGTMSIDGRPPGGPDDTSSVLVQCGDAPVHIGAVDAATGRFVVAHLPGRRCVMHVSSDAREPGHARDLTIDPAAAAAAGGLIVDLTDDAGR